MFCSISTSIHWHGIRQVDTNEEDGVNGITECKLKYILERELQADPMQVHWHREIRKRMNFCVPNLVHHGITAITQHSQSIHLYEKETVQI